MEENGHVVMMAVFDTVDDTVLVKKTLLTVSEFPHNTFVRFPVYHATLIVPHHAC